MSSNRFTESDASDLQFDGSDFWPRKTLELSAPQSSLNDHFYASTANIEYSRDHGLDSRLFACLIVFGDPICVGIP
jgi:hypothetical protein